MIFTYTFRSKSGAIEKDIIEAPSRVDAFAKLRELGIQPVSVKEGGSLQRNAVKVSRFPLSRTFRVALASGGALVAVVVVMWFCLSGSRTEKSEEQTAVKKPVRVGTASKARKSVSSTVDSKGETRLRLPKISTQRIDQRAEIPVPKPLEETQVEEPTKQKPQKIFKRGVEQLLALATPVAPGAPVPPLPHITDESVAEDLKAAMQEAIGPVSNDTERTLEMKLSVAEQKEEFRELNKEGMTFTEYLNALRDKFNQDHEFLAEAHKMNETLYHDATISDEDYKAYRKELNEKLKERGLPELE